MVKIIYTLELCFGEASGRIPDAKAFEITRASDLKEVEMSGLTSISSSQANWNATLYQSGSANSNSDSGSDSTSPVSGGHHHHHGGDMMNAIMESLGKMGVGPDATASTTSTAGASTALTPQQALSAFMQDLFAAAQNQTSGASGVSAAAGTGSTGTSSSYLSNAIQSIVQELGSSSSTSDAKVGDGSNPPLTTTQQTNLSNLQSAFQNLVTAMGGNSTTTGSLKTFLSNLESNIGQQSSVNSSVSISV